MRRLRSSAMVEPPTRHGVLITFRRPVALADHLERLAAQTARLDTVLIVDNDADPQVRSLVEEPAARAAANGVVAYLGLGDNPGPAGGIAAGIAHVLADADDDDWVVLLDDDDPPPRADTLDALAAVTAELDEREPRVAAVGLWGARLHRSGRLRAVDDDRPAPVDYLPGGACPHYRVAALREVDAPDARLFFGFDDLDLGLALERRGWGLWSSGLARDHGWASMVDQRRASPTVGPPTWRRYYSLRNLVVVLRADGRHLAAAWMTLVAGFAKPLVNLMVRPRDAAASLRLNARAAVDGWRGRLGRTIDPSGAGVGE